MQNAWKSDTPLPAPDEEESEPLARPLPGSGRRHEEGAHRRLFGLLPSFLASDREAEASERVEPSGAAGRPFATDAEPDETPAPMHIAATSARALSGDHVAKLQAMLHELQECRRLLDTAMAQT